MFSRYCGAIATFYIYSKIVGSATSFTFCQFDTGFSSNSLSGLIEYHKTHPLPTNSEPSLFIGEPVVDHWTASDCQCFHIPPLRHRRTTTMAEDSIFGMGKLQILLVTERQSRFRYSPISNTRCISTFVFSNVRSARVNRLHVATWCPGCMTKSRWQLDAVLHFVTSRLRSTPSPRTLWSKLDFWINRSSAGCEGSVYIWQDKTQPLISAAQMAHAQTSGMVRGPTVSDWNEKCSQIRVASARSI